MTVPEFNLFHRDLLPASPWRTYREQILVILAAVVILAAGWYTTLRYLAAARTEQAALAETYQVLRGQLEAGMDSARQAADLRQRQELVARLKGEAWSPYLARLRELAGGTGVVLRGITLQKGVLTVKVAAPGLKAAVPFLRSLSRETPFREYKLLEITAAGRDGQAGIPGEYLELTVEIQPGTSAGGSGNAQAAPGQDGQG